MNTIFKEIEQERLKQDAKWGIQNHSPVEWVSILTEEVGEVSKEALEAHFRGAKTCTVELKNYREELIQVAAVAVAMIECLDRNNCSDMVYTEDSNGKSMYCTEMCKE